MMSKLSIFLQILKNAIEKPQLAQMAGGLGGAQIQQEKQ